MKKKILICFTHNHYVRNYLLTDAFEKLEEDFDCYYIADYSNISKKLKILVEKKKNFLGYFDVDKNIRKRHGQIFEIHLFRYFYKSKSFQHRIRVRFNFHLTNIFKKPFLLAPLRIILRYYRGIKRFLKRWPYSFLAFSKLLENIMYNKLPVDEKILNYINNTQPNLVLIPTSAIDVGAIDCVRICNDKKIDSIYLVDNWDNLSSKSIIRFKPKYIATWGQQTLEHAVEIQEIEKKYCKILGTARYEQYFRKRHEILKSGFDFKYILFLGTSHRFNEEEVIIKLNDIINSNQKYKDIKIVYRPHPWRQGEHTFFNNLENVIMDPDIMSVLNDKENEMNSPNPDYYPSLLKNCEFVVGGIQSMMIESAIFGKIFMAMVHNDYENISSMHNVLRRYKHFEGIGNIESMIFCDNINDLENKFSQSWEKKNNVDLEKIDQQRKYILYSDEKTYQVRLTELINQVIN